MTNANEMQVDAIREAARDAAVALTGKAVAAENPDDAAGFAKAASTMVGIVLRIDATNAVRWQGWERMGPDQSAVY